jgi:hypothetical protein
LLGQIDFGHRPLAEATQYPELSQHFDVHAPMLSQTSLSSKQNWADAIRARDEQGTWNFDKLSKRFARRATTTGDAQR